MVSQPPRFSISSASTHPVYLLPDAMDALQALHKAVRRAGVPATTAELISLRASQINGCGVCVVQHPKILRELGETDDRIFAVAAWREAPFFTEAEGGPGADRGADARGRPGRSRPGRDLGRGRTPLRRAGPGRPGAGDRGINVWNRLNVATRQVAGQEW